MNPVRMRAEAISTEQLQVYRALIDGVVEGGVIPEIDALAVATGLSAHRTTEILDELAAADWIGRSPDGAVVALYPFSPTPTGVVVELDGHRLQTMCALDALGVGPMFDRTVQVTSTCVQCGAPIEVTVSPAGPVAWSPPDVVATSRPTDASAYATCCHVTRFACTAEHAFAWIDANGMAGDLILPLPDAFQIGARLFATCYSHGQSECRD